MFAVLSQGVCVYLCDSEESAVEFAKLVFPVANQVKYVDSLYSLQNEMEVSSNLQETA